MSGSARLARAMAGLAALVVGACASASPSATGPGVPTPPPSITVPIVTLGSVPAATLTPAPTVADLPDPCTLLSAAEAQAALSVPFGPGVSTRDDEFRSCTFTSTGSFEATLQLYLPIRTEDAADFFDPAATIEPGVGDGSQFAAKELASPRPGADFGFFALTGDVGVALEYSAFGLRSGATPAATAGATPPATPDPSAVGATIKAALGRLATTVIARLGSR
ncbi:MAG: hypothetical protein ACRDGL_07920 [Candidatus Limnocylindrales bacterium]